MALQTINIADKETLDKNKHSMWLNHYKIYGSDSYVFNDKKKLHELYEDYELSMNDSEINGEAFDYVIRNNNEVGKSLANIYGINNSDILLSLNTLEDVINSETAVNSIIESELAIDAVKKNSYVIAKLSAKLAGLDHTLYDDMNDIANSSDAMNAISNSDNAMNIITYSEIAMDSISNSGVAINIIINSDIAINYLINNEMAILKILLGLCGIETKNYKKVYEVDNIINIILNNDNAVSIIRKSNLVTTKICISFLGYSNYNYTNISEMLENDIIFESILNTTILSDLLIYSVVSMNELCNSDIFIDKCISNKNFLERMKYSKMSIAKLSAKLAGLDHTLYDDMNDIANSSDAMNAISNSDKSLYIIAHNDLSIFNDLSNFIYYFNQTKDYIKNALNSIIDSSLFKKELSIRTESYSYLNEHMTKDYVGYGFIACDLGYFSDGGYAKVTCNDRYITSDGSNYAPGEPVTANSIDALVIPTSTIDHYKGYSAITIYVCV